jgi:hypothetical protein
LPAGARVGVHHSGIVESDGRSTLDAHFRIARNLSGAAVTSVAPQPQSLIICAK